MMMGRQFMGANGFFRIDMECFVPVSNEPVRDDHAMTMKIHSLGTHMSGPEAGGKLQQLVHRFAEFWGQRVVMSCRNPKRPHMTDMQQTGGRGREASAIRGRGLAHIGILIIGIE